MCLYSLEATVFKEIITFENFKALFITSSKQDENCQILWFST